MIIREVADVKADTTGIGIKSTMNPSLKIPISNSTHPQRNVSSITYSIGFPIVNCNVNIAINDDVPILTSLTVPKNTYTIDPMNAEYNPY